MHSLFLGLGTNNQEIRAIHGVDWCIQHRYRKIQLEVESQPLIHWLNHGNHPPWALPRGKAVQPTSYLNGVITPTFVAILHLPAGDGLPKGSYVLEKLGLTTFRRKKLKRIKHPPWSLQLGPIVPLYVVLHNGLNLKISLSISHVQVHNSLTLVISFQKNALAIHFYPKLT
ncbi:hypothetical protein H5410_022453 [Solanum commersonii]|uniref:Uncharacterized protein n=1 Tax=Solanum commersonii TaxID=4109 RepID=A0A9J5ZI08_SOLCO|nr:hypothetical protein H5410_022453 [Solanum commersonii]